jgi:hypothetical protein
MSTFHIFIECLLWLGFVGLGLYFLLTALVPAWREKGWNHWAFSGYRYFNQNPPLDQNSWLVELGFAKPPKPIAEGDFDEGSAVLLYWTLAALFLLIGIGGLVLVVYRSIS